LLYIIGDSSLLKNVADVKNLIGGLRNGDDRLQLLTNIHKSIVVSNSINESLQHILSFDTANSLTTEQLVKVLNTCIDNTLEYITMVDELAGLMDDKREEKIKLDEKSMAI
jgi:hypothetical protein